MRIVDYEGDRITLIRLSQLIGVKYKVVIHRYAVGDRGELLWRPPATQDDARALSNKREKPNYDATLIRTENNAKRIELHEAIASRESARKRRKQQMLDARAAHAHAFSQPLIDAGLLSDAERRAIRESVINKQRWHNPSG